MGYNPCAKRAAVDEYCPISRRRPPARHCLCKEPSGHDGKHVCVWCGLPFEYAQGEEPGDDATDPNAKWKPWRTDDADLRSGDQVPHP